MAERNLPRQSTEVSTAGPIGAAYSVAEKNWKCPGCKAENFARRQRCMRCRERKPKTGGGVVWHEGVATDAAGIDHNWREAMDPSTRQVYYYNTKTNETSWDRPSVMGAAPMATGWFGRGRAGVKNDIAERNAEYLKRPAPKQAAKMAGNDVAYQEGSTEYNIWYGKYVGDQFNRHRDKEPAESRCSVKLHSGSTRADKNTPDNAYFCLWWARGLCSKGSECPYFHHVPSIAECGRLEKDMLHDLFGRPRHAQHRDDMSGTGSFNDNSRTLFVGGLIRTPYEEKPEALKKAVDENFSEWGEVEHLNVIWRLSIAFVRFRMRSHAELAKEAMHRQELGNGEIINTKWAHEDPNPAAKEAIKRANQDAVVAAIKMSGHTVVNPGFNHPSDYKVPIEDSKVATGHYYPITDQQYGTSAAIGPPMPSQARVDVKRNVDSEKPHAASVTKKQRTN